MVVQSVSSDGKTTDVTFTIKRSDFDAAIDILKKF